MSTGEFESGIKNDRGGHTDSVFYEDRPNGVVYRECKMKTWICAVVVVAVVGLSPTPCQADDSEKLDEILRELRALKGRVEVLEKKLASLPVKPVKVITVNPVSSPDLPGLPRPRPLPEVEKVYRMQFESPGTLLKGIHERERRLRQRPFYPELFQR